MSFLNPWAFLALLTVPLLVLLYFLKLKRPHIVVASTLLWMKVIEDMRVNSPFQRLRKSLLLLLQVLVLLAVITALARPLLLVRDTTNESIIVLVDNSASMNAREADGKTRLELARQELISMAENLPSGDEMMVVNFNIRARTLCGFSADKRQLKEAIAAVMSTDCPTALEPALILAKSIAGSRSHPRVIIYSDGAFPAPQGIEMPVQVEYRKIGTVLPNLAITGLDIRRSQGDRNKIEMFVAAENFSKETLVGNMKVRLDGVVLDTKYYSVGPEETLSQVFESVLPAGGVVEVEFDVKDALACDNRAWKVVLPPVVHQVLLVGEQSFFIERVLQSSANVNYTRITAPEYSAEEAGKYSTVIWSAVPAPAIAPCNNIYLGCFPNVAGLTVGASLDSPDIMDWDNTHPVNRFIDYDNLVLASSPSMTLPESAVILLRSSKTPLVGAFRAGGGTACIVGFDPLKSNWPLLVSFPLFINNCLTWYSDQQTGKIESNIPVGKMVTVPATTDTPVIQLPNGEKQAMTKNTAGDFSFNAVDTCGLYTIRLKGNEGIDLAANLFDRNESQLTPVDTPVISGKAVLHVEPGRQMNQEYWKSLLIGVVFLVLLEWLVYHRRWFV